MDNPEFNPNTDQIRSIFKGLEVVTRKDQGGQKIVYEAFHPKYGKIALKLIKPLGDDAKNRILREISSSAELEGPEFAKIHEFGEAYIPPNTILYILEEFLQGVSLRSLLKEKGILSPLETIALAEKLLRALEKVHMKNIVHRDIKPENIIITDDGRTVLIDFGIARFLTLTPLTDDNAFPGPCTPGYAAPEQILNQQRIICPRTDIFLLGIVMYECLTGYNPFTRGCSDRRQAIMNNLHLTVTPLDQFGINRELSSFVRICLEKHVSRRHSSCTESLNVLKTIRKEYT